MRYFAMIEGVQRGPFTVKELIDAGVRPNTYVWCKEMVDWQEARYVAEICRAFRQRLAGVDHIVQRETVRDNSLTPKQLSASNKEPISYGAVMRDAEMNSERLPDPEELMTHPPKMLLPIAILVTIFCFPLTGIMAIFYSVKGRRLWKEAEKIGGNEGDSKIKEAKGMITMAKMMIGISFFVGMIFYAFVIG